MTIKDIIKQTYLEYTGSLLYDGMAITDLMVNPLQIILDQFYSDLEKLTSAMNIPVDEDVDSIDDEIIDAIASKFFVQRKSGEKATGHVVYYFNSRVDVEIPDNTIFSTSNNLNYEITRKYVFSAQQLILDGERYKTPPISVVATDDGEKYRIGPHEIGTASYMPADAIMVTNEFSFSGGRDKETNSELVARIIDGYSTRGLDMVPGIRYRILTDFGNKVEDVEVVGAGDSEMIRDRIYNVLSNSGLPFVVSDYVHKRPGDMSNPNVAFAEILPSTDPLIADFTKEFDLNQYDSIETEGGESFQLSTDYVLNDSFERYNENGESIHTNAPGNGWKTGETGDQLGYGGIQSIDVGGGKVRLGRTGYNYSPVMQKQLTTISGIKITGWFSTNDEYGQISFITVAKHSDPDKARAYEGYGLAWAISDPNHPDLPNLFIVDNDALDSHLNVTGDEWTNSKKIETFLAATSKTILPDVKYNYEIIINSPGMAIEVRIWQDTRPSDADLVYGAYTPMNLRTTTLDGQPQNIVAHDFGIGVFQTNGAVWEYGPIEIVEIAEKYSSALFKIDTSLLPNDGEGATLVAQFKGSGYYNGSETPGALVKIYNFDQSKWETVGENTTNQFYSLHYTFDPFNGYIDGGQKVNILVQTKYPHGVSSTVPIFSVLNVDYIGLRRLSEYENIGGKVDIYVKLRPNSEYTPYSTAEKRVNSVPRIVFLNKPDFNTPIANIESIEIYNGGSPTGVYLTEGVDYRVIVSDPGNRYSVKEGLAIVFYDSVIGSDVNIVYNWFSELEEVHSGISSDQYRKVDTDLLVKHMEPVVIDVTMSADYAGQSVIDAVRKAIWEAKPFLEISDIVNAAYSGGATYVNLDTLVVLRKYTESNGNVVVETITNRTQINRIQCFVPGTVIISEE